MFLKGLRRFRALEGSETCLVPWHSRRGHSCPPPSRNTHTCVQTAPPAPSSNLGNWTVPVEPGFQKLSFRNVPAWILTPGQTRTLYLVWSMRLNQSSQNEAQGATGDLPRVQMLVHSCSGPCLAPSNHNKVVLFGSILCTTPVPSVLHQPCPARMERDQPWHHPLPAENRHFPTSDRV